MFIFSIYILGAGARLERHNKFLVFNPTAAASGKAVFNLNSTPGIPNRSALLPGGLVGMEYPPSKEGVWEIKKKI